MIALEKLIAGRHALASDVADFDIRFAMGEAEGVFRVRVPLQQLHDGDAFQGGHATFFQVPTQCFKRTRRGLKPLAAVVAGSKGEDGDAGEVARPIRSARLRRDLPERRRGQVGSTRR